ncbi:hypothetical protein Tco_1347975, partial [Tanacetum coccineum]
PSDEDGDVGIGDLTGVLVSLGDEIPWEERNYRNSLVKSRSREASDDMEKLGDDKEKLWK